MSDPNLPEILPVFPLTGSLLLPGNLLPLNVFEPRYRHMVADVLEGPRAIGMIQPLLPRQDNWLDAVDPGSDPAHPDLYPVGCAGRIDRCDPQPDGRYSIVLKGVRRFRVRRELPLQRGYRRVEADYSEFQADLNELSVQLDPSPLLGALRGFAEHHGLELDFPLLSSVPGISLLNGLAVALPFGPAEKQALLEAASPLEREEMLLVLMGMGIERVSNEEFYAPPIVN
jgi:Lon protease-like protein